jgi:cation-transporting P-type ATPase E
MALPNPGMTRVRSHAVDQADMPAGLTEIEARDRAQRGQSNQVREVSSRGVVDILKSNLLTRFNALLGSLLVVILILGPLQDAVFGLILVANALIGIAQELRAKYTLDRLAIVAAPQATAVRDGVPREVPVGEIVQGDLLQLALGDEVVVDGKLESNDHIELNEALLTGEAIPVIKKRGDELLAGSFVTAGGGLLRAIRVGEASYARRVTSQARRFQLVPSELMRGINQILRLVTWIIVPTAALLIVSQLRANPSLGDAIRGSVAGMITLVPEGLVLLTSAAMALAVMRLGRKKVLIQQLAAVELLARTDVVCLDKTGTLTEPRMTVAKVEPLADPDVWRPALGAMAYADSQPNPSLKAIAESYPAPEGWILETAVPFSSERKWSAAQFRDRGWWILGAPDVLLHSAGSLGVVRQRISTQGEPGRRTLLLARAQHVDATGEIRRLEPVGLVTLSELIKPGAAQTVKHLLDQGIAIKLISGDHPATLAAIAAQVGLPLSDSVDGRDLPTSERDLVELVERVSIYGRVTPEQKRTLVRAMKSVGHSVAMVGDGVNDVLALKEADLGIAIGGGSAAARAVAACVLTDGSFDGLPAVLAEGRRVIGNVERLASLFFTKTVYAFLLAIAVGVATLPFPFLPRQLTLISAFTIGIPSVYLALSPSFEPSHAGFLRRVLRFSVPAGLVAGAATFTAYALAVDEPNISVSEERTIATLVIASIGLWVLARLARPLNRSRRALVIAMACGLGLTLMLQPVRQFFDLDFPRLIILLAATGIVTLAILVLEATDRIALINARIFRLPAAH